MLVIVSKMSVIYPRYLKATGTVDTSSKKICINPVAEAETKSAGNRRGHHSMIFCRIGCIVRDISGDKVAPDKIPVHRGIHPLDNHPREIFSTFHYGRLAHGEAYGSPFGQYIKHTVDIRQLHIPELSSGPRTRHNGEL